MSNSNKTEVKRKKIFILLEIINKMLTKHSAPTLKYAQFISILTKNQHF